MAAPRVRTDIPAEFIHSDGRSSGHIRNLGAEGLFVGSNEIPDEGETVRLRFVAPSGDLAQLSGLVWWTTNGTGRRAPVSGFGVRLIDANSAYEHFVRDVLP